MARMEDYEISENEILEGEIYIGDVPFVRYFHHNKIPTRYFVSRDGRVYSEISDVIMKPGTNPHGYHVLGLRFKKGKPTYVQVHKMVATVWCGGWHEGLVIDHVDGNPKNNNASNLEWVTYSENSYRAYKTGLHHKHYGDDNHASKYTDADIHIVCSLLEQGLPTKEIAKMTGVKLHTVQSVSMGKERVNISSQYNIPKSYRHLKAPLTDEQKNHIRILYYDGLSAREIQTHFPGISINKIIHAIYDIRYKHK